jgi:hypothetical protein
MPQTIGKDPFTIQVTVEGAKSGTNYLRIDLFKEETNQYFGETFNNSTWYGGSDGKQYFPITIGEEKLATASTQGRVGEPKVTEYLGPGIYKLRVRRYTSSGNDTNDDQTPATIEITIPASSPTPSPQPKATPNPTPVVNSSPQVSARPSPVIARTSPRPSPRKTTPGPSSVSDVLGEIVTNTIPSPSLFPSPSSKPNSIAVPAGIGIMLAGIALSGFAGFMAYRQMHLGDGP